MTIQKIKVRGTRGKYLESIHRIRCFRCSFRWFCIQIKENVNFFVIAIFVHQIRRWSLPMAQYAPPPTWRTRTRWFGRITEYVIIGWLLWLLWLLLLGSPTTWWSWSWFNIVTDVKILWLVFSRSRWFLEIDGDYFNIGKNL